MPDPAGTATPEAPLVVTDRLTGCDVLGAVASQAVNVSASGASHSAPRTRDRSIIRASPKGDVSTIVPSSGSNAPAAAGEPYHLFVGRCRDGARVVNEARDVVGDLTPPPQDVEKVSGQEKYRIRQGDYRVLYSIDYTAETVRSEEHTSELQSQSNLVCRLLLEKKKKK